MQVPTISTKAGGRTFGKAQEDVRAGVNSRADYSRLSGGDHLVGLVYTATGPTHSAGPPPQPTPYLPTLFVKSLHIQDRLKKLVKLLY